MTEEPTMSSKEVQAEAKAAKARDKAMRPWWKKKRVILPLGLVVLIAIAAIAGGGDSDTGTTEVTKTTGTGETTETTAAGAETDGDTKLFPGRPDSQREDQERNIGEAAKLSGYTATVTSAGFQESISDFETKGYIVVEATIENRDDKAQSYNYFDWKLQTPNGQVMDPTFSTVDGLLNSGDLVKGGKVSGKVVFEVGAMKGEFYVIYKPDQFDAARGIWKATA